MPERANPRLSELLRRIRFHYPEAFDLADADPETIREFVRRITNAAYRFNLLVVTEAGGRSGPERAEGLVEQVIAAASVSERSRWQPSNDA